MSPKTTALPELPTAAARRPRTPMTPGARKSRKPSGVSPWPITLLAGGPRAEHARVAALASASEMIDRTFWLSWREREPDALGAIPGVRFEIVTHDGTLDDFEAALRSVAVIERGKGDRPHLIVVDGVSQLWESVKDWGTQQQVASSHASYWYAVNDRWSELLTVLRKHDGPAALIGRRDDDGTLLGHRDLPSDVDVLIEFDEVEPLATMAAEAITPSAYANVTATRTVQRLDFSTRADEFAVEDVWTLLGLGKGA